MRRPPLGPIVRKWQRRLRLLDWKIDPQWVTEEQFAAYFSEDGDETPESAKKMAQLAIASIETGSFDQWNTSPLENRQTRLLVKKGSFASLRDLEAAIVHELLHVVLWPIAPADKDDRGRIFLEQAIITLEEALVPSADGKCAA